MGVFLNMFRRLTDAYTKNPNSNVGKLLVILSGELDELNRTLEKIEQWRDVNQAEGTTLDLIGQGIGQARGQATDEVMRILIRARVAQNLSNGTFNSVLNALSKSLNTTPDNFEIIPLYNHPIDAEPAALSVTGLPLNVLNASGLTVRQFGQIAQKVVGAGVRVTVVQVVGTFSFSSQTNTSETDVNAGFAPLDQSTGGTLGDAYDPENEIDLPI